MPAVRTATAGAVARIGLGAAVFLACFTVVDATPAVAAPGGRVAYPAAAVLSGPITTGHVVEPLSALPSDLAAHGYVEQEFFASGTARAFRAVSAPRDGRWRVEATTSAFYRTRILVRRPADPARFNSTVVVEWMNVSLGESAPEWDYLNPELMNDGYAYVAVSAQAVGVEGGTPLLGSSVSSGLVEDEPARYGTLVHPGDRYSLDMFAQIGRALRRPATVLGGLRPAHVVAIGESQGAFYLTTFADALEPLTGAFDGIFIHSRAGSGASLAGSPLPTSPSLRGLRIRTDLDVPVFMFETQTDLTELGYVAARQPDTDRIRTWEVAGTAHADAYLVGRAAGLLGCTIPVNDGPQHVVVEAAFSAFTRWVVDGTPPPSPPPLGLARVNPPALKLDAHGNVVGGVRTPAVDVPVSTLSGAAPPGSTELCSLFGRTTPFSPAELVHLYGDQRGYLAAYTASLDRAIERGFILRADRAGLLAAARQVRIGA
jgi:hypothetical protein